MSIGPEPKPTEKASPPLPAASGSLLDRLGDGLLHVAAGHLEGARRGRRLEAHQADHLPQLCLEPGGCHRRS